MGMMTSTKTESPGEASSAPSTETLAARHDRARALLERGA
jgi:hypothetical protein